jgi:hypothetical protein
MLLFGAGFGYLLGVCLCVWVLMIEFLVMKWEQKWSSVSLTQLMILLSREVSKSLMPSESAASHG